jgi:streptogramin lyase
MVLVMPKSLSKRVVALLGAVVVLAIAGTFVASTADALAEEGLVALPSTSMREFSAPDAGGPIVVSGDGSVWYATGYSPEVPTRIDRLSSSGVVTGEFGIPTGTGRYLPTTVVMPDHLVLAGDGDIWFVDSYNEYGESLLGRITSNGNVEAFPISRGTVQSIAVGPEGEIWFVSYVAPEGEHGTPVDAIGRMTYDGHVDYLSLEDGGAGLSHGRPSSLAFGLEGALWLADGYSVVARVDLSGTIEEFPVPGAESGRVAQLLLGPGGDIWFEAGFKIGRFTPSGSFLGYLPLSTNEACNEVTYAVPRGGGEMVLGPGGDIWCAYSVGHIERISESGTVTKFSGTNVEGSTMARGIEGDLWFPAGAERIERLEVPRPASSVSSPSIVGSPVVGGILTASNGTWTGEPTSYGYSWESCDATETECSLVPGTGAAFVPTVRDLGRTLRVRVTAEGIGGPGTATSAVVGPVQEAPTGWRTPFVASSGSSVLGVSARSERTIGASMTWRFAWTRRYTIARSLVAHGVPLGGRVTITCRGASCPFARKTILAARNKRATRCHRRSCRNSMRTPVVVSLNLSRLLAGRRLGVGTRVTIDITMRGRVGKTFSFVTRAGQRPISRVNVDQPITSAGTA